MLFTTLTIPSNCHQLFQNIFVFCLVFLVQVPAPEIVSGEQVWEVTEKETHQIPNSSPPIAFSIWMRQHLISCHPPLSSSGSCNSTSELIFLFFLPLTALTAQPHTGTQQRVHQEVWLIFHFSWHDGGEGNILVMSTHAEDNPPPKVLPFASILENYRKRY